MKILFILSLTSILNFSFYSENCKGELKDGNKIGVWKCFYEDGKVMQEGTYTNNKKNGLWKFFHSNGVVALEGTYVDDVEKGKWKVFDEAGKLADTIDYGS